MLTDISKWSHARGNEVVPSRWQATNKRVSERSSNYWSAGAARKYGGYANVGAGKNWSPNWGDWEVGAMAGVGAHWTMNVSRSWSPQPLKFLDW